MSDAKRQQRQTPATLLIDDHYRKLGILEGWHNDRVYRLCDWLGCTVWELASLVAVKFDTMRIYLGKDSFPPTVSLHFAMLESWYIEFRSGAVTKPVVPIDLLKRK